MSFFDYSSGALGYKKSGSIKRDSYRKDKVSKALGKDWKSISDTVREINNWRCADCNKFLGRDSGHVHHIKPLTAGGTSTLMNLTLLCSGTKSQPGCHEKRHPHMRA